MPNPTQVVVDISSRLMPNPMIYVVPSVPDDLASDVLDGSSDHISDQSFLYGFSREDSVYPGLPTIRWNVCPPSDCSY